VPLLSSGVRVCVPATTANLGPGFDCLGAALALYNEFELRPAEEFACRAASTHSDADATQVGTDADNLVVRAFQRLFAHLGQPAPTVALTVTMHVPLGRGLGSSATAIVAGLAAANAWLGEPLSRHQWLELATEIEGHPDNVAPATLGGCQLALAGEAGLVTCPIPWHPDIGLVLAVPSATLSTKQARAVLPAAVDRADAVFNAARTALLVRGLVEGKGAWLTEALADRLHQPYRWALIPGAGQVAAAARAAGAWGTVISGAGPSLLSLAPRADLEAVRGAVAAAWPGARVLCPSLATGGALVEAIPAASAPGT